jgi:hypothetical protein
MPQELIFELGDIRITPYIAQFGGTSYQVGSISGVRVGHAKKINRVAVIVFLLGVGIFVAAILWSGSEERAEANFPMAVTAVGIVFSAFLLQLILPKRVYKLILRTHGGDVEALTSTRRKLIFDVKHAVEDAFVVHAQRSSPRASE